MPNWPMRLAASLLGVFRGEHVEEGARARARDRAERLDEFLTAHADAVVAECDGLRFRVDGDLNGEGPAALDQLGPGDRLVAQLLAGVGGVGDEFANENVAIRIDGMDHQMQQPRNVGLEALRFRLVARLGRDVAGQIRLVKIGVLAPDRPTGAPAALISPQRREVSSRRAKRRSRQKKADRLGGGPPIR